MFIIRGDLWDQVIVIDLLFKDKYILSNYTFIYSWFLGGGQLYFWSVQIPHLTSTNYDEDISDSDSDEQVPV